MNKLINLLALLCIASAQYPPGWNYGPFFYLPYSASQPTEKEKSEFVYRMGPEATAIALGSHISCLKELKATSQRFADATKKFETVQMELAGDISNIKSEIKKLMETVTGVEDLKNKFDVNTNDLAQMQNTIAGLATELKASSGASSIGRMPKTCKDLHEIGHKKSGFYSVMGNKQVESVYCDFTKQTNDPAFQNFIGYIDVKSSPVYFHAQLKKTFTSANSGVPFDTLKLNVGNTMSPSTGIFTAPKTGTYFFAFSGIPEPWPNRVALQMKTAGADWITIAEGYGAAIHGTFSVQSTTQLRQGDQIRVLLLSGGIVDWGRSQNNFVGWLLEEDIFEIL